LVENCDLFSQEPANKEPTTVNMFLVKVFSARAGSIVCRSEAVKETIQMNLHHHSQKHVVGFESLHKEEGVFTAFN
jgi:hypothetical protein